MTAGTDRRQRRSAAVLLCLCIAGAVALHAQEERARIPRLRPPPTVEPRFLQPLVGALNTTVTDVSFRTALGQEVNVARLEIVADPATVGGDVIHARLIRIVRLSFISPVDTITTPFDPFIVFPGPRVRVDRLVLEDATVGTLAHPSQYEGRWLWLQENIDVEVRDISIGGDGPEGLRLVRADMAGQLRGLPLRVTHAAATIARGAGVLDLDLATGLGVSELAIDGEVRRSGAFRFDLATAPLAFAEARAFAPELPAEGSAEIDATVAGGATPFSIALRRAVARVRESVVAASGTIRTGEGGAVQDFVVDVGRLVSADVEALYGISLPGGGFWSGGMRADGPLDSGVTIAGSLERGTGNAAAAGPRQRNGSADAPRFAFDGTVRTEPEASVALTVNAERLPIRDGTARAELRITGPLDSLTLAGQVRSAGVASIDEVVANVNALLVDPAGTAPRRVHASSDIVAIVGATRDSMPREVTARAEARAVLEDDGPLRGRIVADSLPFDLLPLPAALDSVRGAVHVDVEVSGTIDAPVLAGVLNVRGGAFRVSAARLAVHDLAGPIVIEDGVANLDALSARANGGTIDVRGSVRLTGARTADVVVSARDVALLADDSITVFASGEVRATGALAEPLVAADARLTLPRPAGALPLASVRGTLDMARGGALDFELRADSLPLAALPTTPTVRDLRGAVGGLVRIGGTIDEPTSEGRIDLRAAGAYVVRTGTDLADLRGSALVRDGRIVLEDVTGSIGGGALAIAGEARVANGPRTVSLHATVARGRVVDTDSAQVLASADLRVAGPLDRPAIEGTVTLHDGWAHEDNFARTPPLDPDSPPYDELVERVPWIEDSRLRRPGALPLATETAARPEPDVTPADPAAPIEEIAAADGPAFVANVAVEIEPGFSLIDEDSEIHGNGRFIIIADSGGARAEGIYRMTGGYYAQYGSIFEIRGGAFHFTGDGFAPTVSMRSEHRFEAPLGSWLAPGPRVLDRFPPLEFFALGSQNVANEEVRRLSLLPESRTQLGALLLYDDVPQPLTGLETRRFWPPDDGGDLFGASAATRGVVLLWSYIANESYDYLPVERAYMRAGTITVGPEAPGRITIAPYLQGGLRLGALHAVVTQPTEGGTAPGVRLRYRIGAPELLAFSEPFFRSTPPLGAGGPVFAHGRRTGIGIHWGWEW